MDKYISKEIPTPEGDEVKDIYKKSLVKAKRIIADSIKEVFDALTKLFEGKNIIRKMTLRNQLKNVKIQNLETMQSYFTRVAQIKEQLEVVEENVKEG